MTDFLKKIKYRAQPIFFGCALIFVFLFFGKPVLAATEITGEIQVFFDTNNQTVYLNCSDSPSSMLYIHWLQVEGSSYYTNFNSITASIEGVDIPLITMYAGEFLSTYEYKIFKASNIIASLGTTIYEINVDLTGFGPGQQWSLNAFCLEGVSAQTTLVSTDSGDHFGTYNYTTSVGIATSSLGINDRGIFIDFFGSADSISVFTPYADNQIISNPATSTALTIGATKMETISYGNFTHGITSGSSYNYGYHYSFWSPLVSTSSIFVFGPESPTGWLLEPKLNIQLGCVDVGVINTFYPVPSDGPGFGYDVYASSSCVGNEVASGTYISFLGGIFDNTFYLPPPATFGQKEYCMHAYADATLPVIEDYQTFLVNWLASTSDSCNASLLEAQYSEYCAFPCDGIVTSTNPLDLDNFNCGLRRFGCWLTVVDKDTIGVFSSKWQQMIRRFPLAPVTKLLDDITLMSTGTQAIAPGVLAIPNWSTTTLKYELVNYDIGSTTISHSYAWTKWRRFEIIAMWLLLCALPIVGSIIFLIL